MNRKKQDKNLLTFQEAAERLDYKSSRTIRNKVKEGLIRVTLGNPRRIHVSEIERLQRPEFHPAIKERDRRILEKAERL